MRAINSKYVYNQQETDNNKIMNQIMLIKFFQVFRLILFILLLSYFLGTIWFIVSMHTSRDSTAFTFYNEYALGDNTNRQNLVIVMYFMFTTLSTVGFGDFHPKSEVERAIMTLVLLVGVACFSWIMSQFIEILL